MATAEQVSRAAEAYGNAFNRSDRGAFLAAFAEDAVQTDPAGTEPRRGKAAIAAWWDVVYGLCDRIELTSRELYVSNNEAALLFHVLQHRKDGSRVALDGIDIFHVDDAGKIAAVTGYPGPDQPG